MVRFLRVVMVGDKPFIELEFRLRDVATGENLMILRNQAHSDTPEDAAMNYASTLLKFLR